MLDLLKIDHQSRNLALNPTQSYIVQAPAGSGKTELLIQRILTLLDYVKIPEEILAITFTKKAAREMHSRLINALKNAQDPEPKDDHAKLTWNLAKKVLAKDTALHWNLLSNPNRLRIQTIDSLCVHLTKQLPLLANVGASPEISNQPEFIYREAVNEILSHLEEEVSWASDIEKILLHLDNDLNKLSHLLITLLKNRDQWLAHIQLDTSQKITRDKLEIQLQTLISAKLTEIKTNFPPHLLNELIQIATFSAQNSNLSPNSEIIYCKNLATPPGVHFNDKILWQGLARLLLTKEFTWRKKFKENEVGIPAPSATKNKDEKNLFTLYRKNLSDIIAALESHETLRLALEDLFYLPEPHYSAAQWDTLTALISVLKILAAQLRLTFQQYGQIDYIENMQAALTALGSDENPTPLALSLDYQIKHILVDEFQDTSYSHYRLIEKLLLGWEQNDGRSLFIVGDPMQSIYQFREAEVGLFLSAKENGIHPIVLKNLSLGVNFRSTHEIVQWINFNFAAIFPTKNNMLTGAIQYSPCIAHQQTVAAQPQIQIKGFLNTTDEFQANYIVDLIQKIKINKPKDKIAILVRSRTHLINIIAKLKAAKISYRAVDIDHLSKRQIIQDLLALTVGLLHLSDRTAWLSILRAPWCGLTLADLLILSDNNSSITLYEQLINPKIIARLSEDGKQRLARIVPILKEKIANRFRQPLRSLVETTWVLLGGPAYLTNAEDIDDANAFFNLVEEFNLAQEIIDLNKLKIALKNLFAAGTTDDDTLQIMTIHSAKGLEFDTVILPHLERKVSSDQQSLLAWFEHPFLNANGSAALFLAPRQATGKEKDSLYEYIIRQKKKKLEFEMDRLFYVAVTRAKNELHLLFNVEQNAKGEYQGFENSFLAKLWPSIQHELPAILVQSPTLDAQKNKSVRYIKRLIAQWDNPIKELTENKFVAHENQNSFILPDETPKQIGVLTHRLLQEITINGSDYWQETPQDEQLKYIQNQLTQLSMRATDLNFSAALVHQAIHNMLNDKRGQWILHPHHQARSEFSFCALIDGKIKNMIIDRIFIDEKNICWIIDYKTSINNETILENFLDQEQKKYFVQLDQYHRAIKLIENRPIKIGLYFPLIPAWREWEPAFQDVTPV